MVAGFVVAGAGGSAAGDGAGVAVLVVTRPDDAGAGAAMAALPGVRAGGELLGVGSTTMGGEGCAVVGGGEGRPSCLGAGGAEGGGGGTTAVLGAGVTVAGAGDAVGFGVGLAEAGGVGGEAIVSLERSVGAVSAAAASACAAGTGAVGSARVAGTGAGGRAGSTGGVAAGGAEAMGGRAAAVRRAPGPSPRSGTATMRLWRAPGGGGGRFEPTPQSPLTWLGAKADGSVAAGRAATMPGVVLAPTFGTPTALAPASVERQGLKAIPPLGAGMASTSGSFRAGTTRTPPADMPLEGAALSGRPTPL